MTHKNVPTHPAAAFLLHGTPINGRLSVADCFLFWPFFGGGVWHLSHSQAAQSQQHSWVGDVPIMADLSVEPALGFAFDSPNGRIVMIFASSTANAADILGFTMNR